MAAESGESRLFIGQLSFDANEEDIRQIFDFYGTVIHVNVERDRVTGRSKGSAFVTYSSTLEADAAIVALHDEYDMGRKKKLQVMYCQRTQNISDFGREHGFRIAGENPSNPPPV